MKTLRRLGLAGIAAIAMMAASVPATASATSAFFAEDYPAVVTGDPNGTGVSLHRGTVEYGCAASPFESEVPNPTSSLSAVISWGKCHIHGGEGAYPESNGCKLIFHPGPEQSEGTFKGTVDIGPADCGPIVLDIANDTCPPFEIPPQTGMSGVTYVNNGSGGEADISISMNFVELEMISPWKPGCSTTVYMSTKWSASAKTTGGSPIGLYAEDLGQVGAFMNGETGFFDAEAFPVTLGGSETGGGHEISRGTRDITCDSVETLSLELHESHEILGTASTDYAECASNLGGPVTIEMNGCRYYFASPGGLVLSCPEGQEIRIDAYLNQTQYEEGGAPTCAYTIEEQEVGGVSYDTVGLVSFRRIEVDVDTDELVTKKILGSKLLCGPDEHTSTKYSGGVLLDVLNY